MGQWGPLAVAALGGGGVTQLVVWLLGRRERKASLAETSVETAEEAVTMWREAMSAKMTVLELRMDELVRTNNELFEELKAVYKLLENGNGH